MKKNGVVTFDDPQTGEISASYKLRQANLNEVYLLRIDNLKFTNAVKRCAMNRGEKL